MSQTSSVSAHGGIGTPEEIAYEARAQEGSIWTGGRVLMGVFAFAFAALAFAYFYLRSSNNLDMWRPHNMTAPVATGTAIMSLALASWALTAFGIRRMRGSVLLDWEVSGWTAVLTGLIAFGLQIWELTDLPFAPGASGYASVFIGWAGMNLVLLIGGVYWTETLLARCSRLRRAAAEEGGGAAALLTNRLFRVNAESCAAYWLFIAGISIFFWVFFYIAA